MPSQDVPRGPMPPPFQRGQSLPELGVAPQECPGSNPTAVQQESAIPRHRLRRADRSSHPSSATASLPTASPLAPITIPSCEDNTHQGVKSAGPLPVTGYKDKTLLASISSPQSSDCVHHPSITIRFVSRHRRCDDRPGIRSTDHHVSSGLKGPYRCSSQSCRRRIRSCSRCHTCSRRESC